MPGAEPAFPVIARKQYFSSFSKLHPKFIRTLQSPAAGCMFPGGAEMPDTTFSQDEKPGRKRRKSQ
jgi:hypothetical protein